MFLSKYFLRNIHVSISTGKVLPALTGQFPTQKAWKQTQIQSEMTQLPVAYKSFYVHLVIFSPTNTYWAPALHSGDLVVIKQFTFLPSWKSYSTKEQFSSLESCLNHVHMRRGSILHIWMIRWPHIHLHGPPTCPVPQGPVLRRDVYLNSLLSSFWISYEFVDNGPAFLFFTGLYKLCSWSWLAL